MCKIRNSVNRAWYFERFIIDFFLCRNGLTLIGTDSIIKIKPGMQWTLMKPVWRNHLINQLLLAYLIMTNYSVIILKRIYSFTTVKTHQLLFTMLVLKWLQQKWISVAGMTTGMPRILSQHRLYPRTMSAVQVSWGKVIISMTTHCIYTWFECRVDPYGWASQSIAADLYLKAICIDPVWLFPSKCSASFNVKKREKII